MSWFQNNDLADAVSTVSPETLPASEAPNAILYQLLSHMKGNGGLHNYAIGGGMVADWQNYDISSKLNEMTPFDTNGKPVAPNEPGLDKEEFTAYFKSLAEQGQDGLSSGDSQVSQWAGLLANDANGGKLFDILKDQYKPPEGEVLPRNVRNPDSVVTVEDINVFLAKNFKTETEEAINASQ